MWFRPKKSDERVRNEKDDIEENNCMINYLTK